MINKTFFKYNQNMINMRVLDILNTINKFDFNDIEYCNDLLHQIEIFALEIKNHKVLNDELLEDINFEKK